MLMIPTATTTAVIVFTWFGISAIAVAFSLKLNIGCLFSVGWGKARMEYASERPLGYYGKWTPQSAVPSLKVSRISIPCLSPALQGVSPFDPAPPVYTL